MAALDFPPSPVVGDKYPVTPVPGQPQYTWDGEKWTTTGAQVTSASPSNNLPLINATTAVPGVGTQYSREDHVHPTDTSRAADTAVLKKVPQTLTVTEQTDVRKNLYAAPFDALGWSGMQINGSIDVSQELGTVGLGNVNGPVCDGWRIVVPTAGSVVGSGQVNNPAIFTGFANFLHMGVATAKTSLAATDLAMFYQQIEGYRIMRLAWGTANAQPLTVGFWSRHFRAGSYSVSVQNFDGSRSCVMSYTHNVSATPQFNVVTFPGCTDGTWKVDNTIGISLGFASAVGTTYIAPATGTWYPTTYRGGPSQINAIAATTDYNQITGVVVLPGVESPTAARSPLIMRPYDEELITCQRYYETSRCNFRSGFVGGNYVWVPARVIKRTAPTCSLANVTYTNTSTASLGNPTVAGAEMAFSATVTGGGGYFFCDTVMDARL